MPEVHFATSCPRVGNLILLCRIFWRFLDVAFVIKYSTIYCSDSPPDFFSNITPNFAYWTDFQFSEIFCLSLIFSTFISLPNKRHKYISHHQFFKNLKS